MTVADTCSHPARPHGQTLSASFSYLLQDGRRRQGGGTFALGCGQSVRVETRQAQGHLSVGVSRRPLGAEGPRARFLEPPKGCGASWAMWPWVQSVLAVAAV